MISKLKSTPRTEDPSDAEDIAWMLAAKQGDTQAFSKLIRKHEQALMNFFVRSGVYRDVEDLAQLTFLKLYKARGKYQPSAKFTTFLYLLARQVLVDNVRASTRRSALHEKAGAEQETTTPPSAYRGEGEDAQMALAALSQNLRETVVLVIMQGLAYQEAAEILGIPVGTVKSRIHSALAQMRDVLQAKTHFLS